MLTRWLLAVRKRGSEILSVLGLVSAYFVLFLALLSLTFPEGTSIRSLIENEDTASLRESLGFRDDDFSMEDRHTEVATLLNMTNRVKDRNASGISWKDSKTGEKLGNRHSIQTFDNSTATIAFDEKNRLDLGSNSLVVLKSFNREDDGSDRRASLVVMGGHLRGELEASSSDSLQVEVETSFGTARIRSADEATAVFQVNVNEDSTSTIAVEEGVAEILTSSGTLVISSDRMVRLSKDAEPIIVDLPQAPRLIAPPLGVSEIYRSQPPLITFRWSEPANAEEYRFLLASDPDFENVVHESHRQEASIDYGNLGQGSYFWRVAGRRFGAEGLPSATGTFELVQDLSPPEVSVVWPEGVVHQKSYVISGHAEAKAQVFIENERVEVSDSGLFSHVVELRRGMNIVVVEVVDPVGNSTFHSRTLNAQY